MKIRISSMLCIAVLSCKNVTTKETDQEETVADSTELIIKPNENHMEFPTINGIWISTADSLSSVEINSNKWVFKYENVKTELGDSYDYLITESVMDEDNSIIGGNLMLTNQSDTLKYGIDYISDQEMTLIYLPRGNFQHYQKK